MDDNPAPVAPPLRRSWLGFLAFAILALLSLLCSGCGGQKRETGDCLLSKEQAPQVAQAWADASAAGALASAPDATPEQTAAAIALWKAGTARLLAGLANANLPLPERLAGELSDPSPAGEAARAAEVAAARAAPPAPAPTDWTLWGAGGVAALSVLYAAKQNKAKVGAVLSALPPPAGPIIGAVSGWVADAVWNLAANKNAHAAETARAQADAWAAEAQRLATLAGPALDAVRADPTLANRIPPEVWYLVNLVTKPPAPKV